MYFKYVIGEMIKECTNRVKNLDHYEFAYISKGLVNLSPLILKHEQLSDFEFEFRTWMLSRLSTES